LVVGKKHRKFTEEFRREAVKLVTERGYTLREAAQSLGIRAQLICEWKKRYATGVPVGETRSGLSSAERAELERLRAENKRLLMEREILKKAAAFFAQEKD
jgi:transposase